MPDEPCTRILIVGAGFAGTQLVRSLHRRLPAGVALTLLSDESYTTFNPMLPEAVGASVFPEQVVVPVREMTRRNGACRFIMGSVTQVDLAAGRLGCRTLAGDRELDYDHLVLAIGNRARLDLMPGMAEHALPLKTVGDAMHIRNTVLRRLACIELEGDAALRRALGHFIVGGGFSRVVVAGDLSVPGYPGLWALGDCACVPNALDGSTAPPTAQFAVCEAQHLAHNLRAVVTGAPTTPFRYRSRGMMASIGHLKGVAEVAGVPLTGWPAWLVWRAYYLSQMPSSGRRLRIFFEWFWGMFYPPDITHLRFTRSAELSSDEARRHREADTAVSA